MKSICRLVDLLLFGSQIHRITDGAGDRDEFVQDGGSSIAPIEVHRRQTVAAHDALGRFAKVESEAIFRGICRKSHPSEFARWRIEEERVDKLFRDVLRDALADVFGGCLDAFFRQLFGGFTFGLAKRGFESCFRKRHGAISKAARRKEYDEIDRGFDEVTNDAGLVVIGGRRRLHRTVLKNQGQREHAKLPAFRVDRDGSGDGRWSCWRSADVHGEAREPALLFAEDGVDRREQIERIRTDADVRPQELGIVLIDDRRTTAVHEHGWLFVSSENERMNGRDADEKRRHHERRKVDAHVAIDTDDVEPRLIVEVVGHGFTSMLPVRAVVWVLPENGRLARQTLHVVRVAPGQT